MSKHTNGPWRLNHENCHVNGDYYHSIDAGVGYCCDGDGDGFNISGCMSIENARLIAAAPELLEALIAAKNTLIAYKFQPGDANCWEDHDEENLAMVDAAIAKARGEA